MHKRSERVDDARTAEESIIASVAHAFSATWHAVADASAYQLAIGSRRIVAHVVGVAGRTAHGRDRAQPRLRFDKVVQRVVRDLHDALSGVVPDGTTLVVTITAPIRLPAKTVSALDAMLRPCLATRSLPPSATIHGNAITLRLIGTGGTRVSKVIGFVHNADTDADVIVDTMQSLIDALEAAAAAPVPADDWDERWLILVNAHAHAPAPIETVRQVYAQLGAVHDFARILMVVAEGRIEPLAPLHATDVVARGQRKNRVARTE